MGGSGCGACTAQNERVVVRDGKRRGGSRSYRRRRRWCAVRTRWVSSAECRFGLATVAGSDDGRRTVPTTMRPTFGNDTYLSELPLQQAARPCLTFLSLFLSQVTVVTQRGSGHFFYLKSRRAAQVTGAWLVAPGVSQFTET